MKLFKLFAILIILLSASVTALAQTITPQKQCAFSGIDYAKAIQFVQALRLAIKHNDKQRLAKLVHYPLMINKRVEAKHAASNNKANALKKFILQKITIKTEKQFVQEYELIFTSELKAKILKDPLDNIFCNWQGAMISDGSIWFKGNPLRIFVINLPDPSLEAN